MPLPVINNIPKYSLKIPSTKQEIRYRPFLTSEERVLKIALETQDQRQIMSAMLDTVMACLEQNSVKPEKTYTV